MASIATFFSLYSRFLFASLILGVAGKVQAEFVSINPLVKHVSLSRQGSAGVIVLPDTNANTGPKGILIYSTKKNVSAQAFTTRILKSNDSDAVFLGYSSSAKRYNQLTVAGGKTYEVQGNLNLVLATVRVSLSYENNREPYVSIIFNPDNSVISFLGLQSIVNGKGENLLRWLDAGMDAPLSETFRVDGNKRLIVGDTIFDGTKIGLPNQNLNQNICLTKGVLLISKARLKELRGKTSFSSLLKDGLIRRSHDFLEKNLLVEVFAKGLVIQDGYGQLLTVQPEKEPLFDETAVCVYEPLI